MISLEGLIRELFLRANAWQKILLGGVLCYLLLGFGYLRRLAKSASDTVQLELPPFTFDKQLTRLTFSALPMGSFYFLVPLFLAYGVDNLLRLLLLGFLSPVAWGLGAIVSLTLVCVALVTVPEDPERFFLGLEFEKVLQQWWKLKRVWAVPALVCYGLMAIFGLPFYGLTGFISAAFLVSYLGLAIGNQRYS